jgi:uncharacterized protein YbjT (DUF2867 family)
MKIVVIGGTGLIGSKVVSKLTQLGHAALAAAPNTGVNTITGEGLAEALEGAQVDVDLANSRPTCRRRDRLSDRRAYRALGRLPGRPPPCARFT